MWYPWTWQDRSQVPPSQGLNGYKFGYLFNVTGEVCDQKTGARCAFTTPRLADYFANFTFIPSGEPTITQDMIDPV